MSGESCYTFSTLCSGDTLYKLCLLTRSMSDNNCKVDIQHIIKIIFIIGSHHSKENGSSEEKRASIIQGWFTAIDNNTIIPSLMHGCHTYLSA